MAQHVCPWWGGYFIDNPLRRWLHPPEKILAPYVQAGMSVMDFGCGMGMFSIAMAHMVGRRGSVVAVDLQQQMLDVLERRATSAGVADRIRTHRCAADSLNWDQPVDFALAFYSAHEVPDAQRLFDELFQCLRPGGQWLLIEPIGHVRKKRFQTFRDLAEKVGFQIAGAPKVRWSHTALLRKS